MQKRSSVLVFSGLCMVSAAGLGWMFRQSAARVPQATAVAEPAAAVETPVPAAVAPPRAGQRVFFRSTDPEKHYGQLAYVEYPGSLVPTYLDQWNCEALYVAGGKGSCLTADRGVFTTYTASIFDARFQKLHVIPLNGIPSRTRVSPNGRLAAVTVFVTGHGYDSVDFTTQTSLIDTRGGAVIADLEKFQVTKDGQPFEAKDFNYWGVTFAPDSDRFYATLSTNRKHFLIQGSVQARSARVLHENVECPSLSPDATRVAYKKRLPGDRVVWQLHVLDLKTLQETPLAERRSVDDQLEWLDNATVLYSLPHSETPGPSTDVWQAPADGQGTPRRLIAYAYSPSVSR